MMDKDSFLQMVSICADIITLAGVIAAGWYGIVKKDQNLIAFKVSQYIHYLLRTAGIIFLIFILLSVSKEIFYWIFLIFNGQSYPSGTYWESEKAIIYIAAYFCSMTVLLALVWMACSFIWTSSWNSTIELFNLFLPKNKILKKTIPYLEIINATYGSDENKIDVTTQLRQMVKNNKLTIKASNDIAGDPHPKIVKSLIIKYRIGSNNFSEKVFENDTISIPENNN